MKDASERLDAGARGEIYRAFRASTLLVPIQTGDGGAIEVRAPKGAGGRPIVLAFTHEDALRAWVIATVQWATVTGPELAAFALEQDATGLALNPAGPFGGQFTRSELESLADTGGLQLEEIDDDSGVARLRVVDGSGIVLRGLPSPARGLERSIAAALDTRTDVVCAYLLESSVSGDPRLALGLLLATEADAGQVAAALGAALKGQPAAGEVLDLYPLEGELLRHVASAVEPIWDSGMAARSETGKQGGHFCG
jgi:hypothetical protein